MNESAKESLKQMMEASPEAFFLSFAVLASISFLVGLDSFARDRNRLWAFLWFLGSLSMAAVFVPVYLIQKYSRSFVADRQKNIAAQWAAEAAREKKSCSYCRRELSGDPAVCPFCGNLLRSSGGP